MIFKTLIPVDLLADQFNNPDWAIIDCRFSLTDTSLGRKQYEHAHIPGAVYANLDEHLSGQVIPGKTSRHPLPPIETFAGKLSAWGIGETTQVVVYDDASGAIAARLWWMLGWLGHEAVAVLDGGWQHWLKNNQPTKNGVENRPSQDFNPRPNAHLIIEVDQVLAMRNNPDMLLVDSRSPERFRGEEEPYDSIAGHIPGALNLPFKQNLNNAGLFIEQEELRTHFENILGEVNAKQTVFYCGSGVTAAHNILALVHAGLGQALLYPGSWSEWITDPSRPIEKSDQPG
ncbi:MAG: sulfurtransferase [Chloroflexi bacterium]|nr:sulfurtransferase [Chloroflexota bacterium]